MKKGFTLIELLAVIVILAIIALIATPIILNIIKSSKTSSNERSVENYAKAIENMVAKEILKTNGDMDSIKGFYYTADGKTITNGINTYTIDYDGAEVSCKDIEIYKNGAIYLEDCKVENSAKNDYTQGTKEILKYANKTPKIEPENIGIGGDTILATLYDNAQLGGNAGEYTLVLTGKGKMKQYFNDSARTWYSYRQDIVNIEIEYGIENIGALVLSGSPKVENIEIPNSVTSIGIQAFGNLGLKSVVIPSGVTTLPSWAFGGNLNLSSIVIPSTVTNIDKFAFIYDTKLTKIYYKGSLTVPENKWGAENATVISDF